MLQISSLELRPSSAGSFSQSNLQHSEKPAIAKTALWSHLHDAFNLRHLGVNQDRRSSKVEVRFLRDLSWCVLMPYAYILKTTGSLRRRLLVTRWTPSRSLHPPTLTTLARLSKVNGRLSSRRYMGSSRSASTTRSLVRL